MLLAQISDLHIKPPGRLAYGKVDTATMLRAAVTSLLHQSPAPDAVLATGDLVDGGHAEEYALLREILSPIAVPCFLVAGNHDERQSLREAFHGPGFAYLDQAGEFLQYAVDLGKLRLLVLDTVVPGEGRGQLCTRRLRWLDERLSEDPRPTLVAMHHPPFATGIDHMDDMGLEGAEAFEAVISRHPHVERILCGHLHRSIQCRVGGTVASVCPSTAHQVALNLRLGAHGAFVMEPPGYQLHWWEGSRLVSHTCPVGDFPGPYPFQ
ncbi:phosphodiesterase [Hydrogenophaga sp.]|jgi:Icc protein|uniref:phosphodiesterase n=1 Tax=Hydrogenophaga sp. TaxID=1904254 RepID=UPI003F7160B2